MGGGGAREEAKSHHKHVNKQRIHHMRALVEFFRFTFHEISTRNS